MLAGSLFVRDALKYDYCLQAAVESLLPLCDRVAVLDCGSTDGTVALLESLAILYPWLSVLLDGDWDVAAGPERLRLLADRAQPPDTGGWHFMLQADEVLHERSYEPIRAAVVADGWGHSSFRVRRLTVFGALDRQIKVGSPARFIDDSPTRLARAGIRAVGDGESLEPVNVSDRLLGEVTIVHYGYVRRPMELIEKMLAMYAWGGWPEDGRREALIRMRSEAAFSPSAFIPEAELCPLEVAHPALAATWVEAHRP